MLLQVEETQLNELLRQNKEMKEDIYLLLSSVNYFTEFIPKDLGGNTTEAPSLPMLMVKMAPIAKRFMEQMKNPQMQFTIQTLKEIHEKYVKIQQPTQQNKTLSTGTNGTENGTDSPGQ